MAHGLSPHTRVDHGRQAITGTGDRRRRQRDGAFGVHRSQGHIKKLEEKGNKAKVLKSTIGETIRLREEWKKAHDSGSASASGLLRKLESNLDGLRKQGSRLAS